jgi:hypothetical protein
MGGIPSRTGAPRKIITRVVVFLLLGAVVNVAVAAALWFCGERPATGTFQSFDNWETRPATSRDLATWERWKEDAWPSAPNGTLHQSKFGMRFRHMIGVTGRFDSTDLTTVEWKERAKGRSFFSIKSTECGWPLTCVRVDFATEHVGMPPRQNIRLGGWRIGQVWIPNEVALDGFFLNTIFYAAGIYLLLTAIGALLRWRRIRRGLCPACAYPVGASEVCTECGRTLPAHP